MRRSLMAAAALAAGLAGPAAAADPPRPRPAGPERPARAETTAPELEAFDRMLSKFLADHKLPGVAAAVAKDGRLVYARGFGHADREHHEPMHAGALFRIASLSKPVTAAAVLHLVDQGKLKLTDHVFDVVGLAPHFERSGRPDPRLRRVTVLECLQHTGGWDRDKSLDPMSGR